MLPVPGERMILWSFKEAPDANFKLQVGQLLGRGMRSEVASGRNNAPPGYSLPQMSFTVYAAPPVLLVPVAPSSPPPPPTASPRPSPSSDPHFPPCSQISGPLVGLQDVPKLAFIKTSFREAIKGTLVEPRRAAISLDYEYRVQQVRAVSAFEGWQHV